MTAGVPPALPAQRAVPSGLYFDNPPVTFLHQVGVRILLMFLFLAFSRVAELSGLASLHLPLVLSCLGAVLALLGGGLHRALFSAVGLCLTFFTAWLALCIPLSYWKGGSFELFTQIWIKSFLFFLLVAGLLRTWEHCRMAIHVIAYAVLTVAILGLYYGTTLEGRLILPVGSLSNSNDMAQVLLTGFPGWLFIAMRKDRLPFRKIAAFLCMVPIVYAILGSGSRAALIAIVSSGVVWFFQASTTTKVKLMFLGFVLALAAAVALPEDLKVRYKTLFLDDSRMVRVGMVDVSAAASAESRLLLLKQSLRMTLKNPLFGVGPGVFQAVASAEAEAEGPLAPKWRETHNAYTQISSECGIPALIAYLIAMIWCIRSMYRLYQQTTGRPELAEISNLAFCMMLSLVCFSVTAFFSSVAYNLYFPALAGLAVAITRASQQEIRNRTGAASPAPVLASS